MVTKVNPPIAVLRSTQFGSEAYKRGLEDIINQLWTKTGGGGDSIENITIEQNYTWDALEDIETGDSLSSMFGLETAAQSFNSVSTNQDYTMVAFDFVNAKSSSTITLPEYPEQNDVVIIRNGDGSRIKFLGNGKDINGESSGAITRKGTTLIMQYFLDDDEWFAR